MSRRAFGALIGAVTLLTLVAASLAPVAAASSRPAITLGTSVNGTDATVTVDVNRASRRIVSCDYVIDGAAAASCGSSTHVPRRASRYTISLTGQAAGSHTVSVQIVLTGHRTISKSATFKITADDIDKDGVPNATDNCPTIANPNQANRYGSAKGDACEDTDGDGTLDVNEANICVSVDGAAILGPIGTATCESSKSTGATQNTAVANGDWADASAGSGDGNVATAVGDGASAMTDDNGNHNTAVATGDSAGAHAGFGNNNTATATGSGAFAAAIGNNNTATATGNSATAFAQAATGCTAVNSICP
jgi:hypothetical protein